MIEGTLAAAAAVFLALFAALAAIDGLYIHPWKLRLHRRPRDAQGARAAHAPRGAVPRVRRRPVRGPLRRPLLWAAAAVAVLDLGVGLWDVAIERDSRW
jgi:hypothetical protein